MQKAKRVFPEMVFVPGNGLVLDLAITASVPVVKLGSNKTTQSILKRCRKSPGK
jgi:hypothetical protein